MIMKKEETEVRLQGKEKYQAPQGMVFQLGQSLSFLVQSFSSPGELDQLDEGGEFGVDENGNPIV